LRGGDVVVALDGEPVASVEDIVAFTGKVTAGQTEPVAVLVGFERKKERLLAVVKVGLRKLKDPGLEARKAWLPIETQVLTKDLAEALDVPGKSGVRVTRILPNGQDVLDVQVGDLIVGLDGQRIPAVEPEDVEVLPAMVRQYKIGSEVELDVIREGERLKVAVTLPTSRKLPREMKKYRDNDFEITVREIAFSDRAHHQWDTDKRGVLVQEVTAGSWAALGRLAVGDLLLEVDGRQVESVKTFETIMTAISVEKPEYVVLKVLRGIHTRYIEIEPNWEEVA
jgi:serine protease Do